MKQILFSLLAFIVIVAMPVPTFAINLGGGANGPLSNAAVGAGYDQNTTETTFAANLGVVVRVALSLTGIIFLSLTVYAGLMWMTARGDEAKVEKAIAIIRASVIGLLIAVSAYSLTEFVVPRLVGRTSGATGISP